MDKNEYKICADEIRALIKEKQYKEAVEIADTINWKNVVNTGMLCTVSDLYKICKRFEDSRDVMYLAYQRNPSGRMILYSLCELSIKLGDVVNAVAYFKEFVQIAPKDTGRFVLKYKLYTAQEVGLDERIGVLEELQKYECKEKWMYELAYLYHMNGYSEKCVEECNQIVIYFGEGKYVLKALDLKALHEPLSLEQDILYKRLTAPKENDILVKEMDVSKFNTIDLQKELANSLAEVWFDDTRAQEALNAEKEAERLAEEKRALAEEKEREARKAAEEARLLEEKALEEARQKELEETKVLESIGPKEQPVSDDPFETKVFNIKEIEESIKKEPAISRTVVPNRGFDEMREVMPHSVENRAIVFRNYDDMVSMEGDGQISFNVPDQEVVDKQITGQISIQDVLAEFERMKNASEKKWRDDMRRKVLQQTNVLFQDFDENAKTGLLEELETEVVSSPRVELTKEEEDILIGENLMPAREEVSEEIFVDEADSVEADPSEVLSYTGDIPIIPAAAIPGAVITIKEPVIEEEKEEKSHDVHEIIFEDEPDSEEEQAVTEEEPVSEEPSPEELFFDRTPFIEKEIETETQTEVSGPEPEDIDNTIAIPQTEEVDDYFMRFAEAGEERDRLEQNVSFPEEEELSETADNEEEIIFEEESPAEESFAEEPLPEEEPVSEEESFPEGDSEPYEEEEEDPEESAEEFDEYPEEERNEEEADDITGLSIEQKERFEAFIQTESGLADIKAAISAISMDSSVGNVFIGSEYVDSAVDLGIAFIKELSSKEEVGLKVGKIKASILNAKAPEVLKETLSKQYGSAVIILDANELRPETMAVINSVIFEPDKKLFVVFTATQRGKHRFLMANGGVLPGFDVNIDVETLNPKELAAFGRAYAYGREYAIDEMGMLALHTRIEEKQSISHCVNVTEVKHIVDEAIAKATKKNPKHFFDTLVGNRYDDNDMIVLREKDFSKSKE